MKNKKHKKNQNSHTETTGCQRTGTRRPKYIAVLMGFLVVMAVVAVCILLHFSGQMGGRQAKTDYRMLGGDWMRPDGGYVIRIGSVDPDGQIQAAYFNPNPIKVAEANVSFHNNTMKLFVELRDEGYPGSTYNLTYDPAKDVLEGTYFQAQVQQLYEVVFQRMK